MVQFGIRIVLSVWVVLGILCVHGFSYGANEILTSFGSGPVKVRLYSDYFCGPCRAVEPQLEPIIRKLVSDNKINLTFIDAPIFKHSPMYARYFLYATKGMNELESILRVRSVLFEAAKENVTNSTALEAYLKQREVHFQSTDVSSIFAIRDVYLRSDDINSTPSCVIEQGDKKELYKGARDIISALKRLE